MKEWVKVFASLSAVIGGILCIIYYLTESSLDYWYERAVPAVLGVAALAAGVSYLWMSSRFYRR